MPQWLEKSLSRLCLQEQDHQFEENARSCDIWLWKDDYIDPRSKFIGELEYIVESSEKVETSTKEVNKPTKSTKSMKSRLDMNKIDYKFNISKSIIPEQRSRFKEIAIVFSCTKNLQYCVELVSKTTYLKHINEVNEGNFVTFSIELLGVPLPLLVGALGVTLGSTSGVALGPAVFVNVGETVGLE
uniref:Uncharacterized protein n=1 Tax=Solanum lycopersicum TaxID=4081 RepID=A0A3Q7HN84_SOLLC